MPTLATLRFEGSPLDVIDRNGQLWLGGPQIADALGMRDRRGVHDIYDRNADEFTDEMTALLDLPTDGGVQKVRVFSPRGCYLIAMFARTDRAKAFRKWVLDVLEKATGHAKLPSDTGASEFDERRLIDDEISASSLRLCVDKARIRKYYEDEFNQNIFRALKAGKFRHIVDWLRTIEKPKPRVVLMPHIQDAAVRTGLSSRAVLHRVYKHFLVTSLKELTYEQKLAAVEWLSVMGRENQPAFQPPSQHVPGAQAGMIRLELVVPLDKAQRILAIAGE